MSYTIEQMQQLVRLMGKEFLTLIALEANGVKWSETDFDYRKTEIESILAEEKNNVTS